MARFHPLVRFVFSNMLTCCLATLVQLSVLYFIPLCLLCPLVVLCSLSSWLFFRVFVMSWKVVSLVHMMTCIQDQGYTITIWLYLYWTLTQSFTALQKYGSIMKWIIPVQICANVKSFFRLYFTSVILVFLSFVMWKNEKEQPLPVQWDFLSLHISWPSDE